MQEQRSSIYHLTIRRGLLDPRTKLVLLILMAVFCLGGAGGERLRIFRILLSLLPYALSFTERKWKKTCASLAVLLICHFYLERISGLLPMTDGAVRILSFLLLLTANLGTRLLPSLAMGDYTIRTTSVSEFTAAMRRMRMPDTMVIPMSVMFRFFPTIGENAGAIREAMVMRDIRFTNFSRFLEYRLVPLVECTTSIGDDLSASAMMRGLGAPVKRTDICRIGFRIPDLLVLLAPAAFFILSLMLS